MTPPAPNLLVPFAVGHCANDMVPIAMYILIPAFGLAMDLSPAEIGLLFMIHNIGGSLAFFPAGVIADHVENRGRLLAATFFWVAIGYFAASFSDGFWTFAILIAIAGMGDAAWHPIATGVLAQLHNTRRAYALGVHAVGGHISEVIALPVAGFLLAAWDWRIAIQVLIIPTVVMGLVFLFVAPHVPKHVNSRPTMADFADIWRIWTTRAGLRVIAMFTAYNMSLFAIIAMAPLYMKVNQNFDWQETALVLAAMMLFGAVLQPGAGKLSDRIGRRPLIVGGNAIAAVAGIIAWASSGFIATLLALGVALTVLVAIRAVLLAAAVDHAGGREGASLGLTFAFMDGFAATAAVMAGLLGEIDLKLAFLLSGGFAILAVAFGWVRPASQTSDFGKA